MKPICLASSHRQRLCLFRFLEEHGGGEGCKVCVLIYVVCDINVVESLAHRSVSIFCGYFIQICCKQSSAKTKENVIKKSQFNRESRNNNQKSI